MARGRGQANDEAPPPFEIEAPERQLAPVVYASPHSGDHYPPDLQAATPLSAAVLRRSEDSFVDRLFAAAPAHGSPLLRARYARVYLDPNREPWELDPAMFAEPLPEHVNTTSLRVAGGLGTVARVVADGQEVYARKLRFAEAEARIHGIYYPYHRALADLVTRTRRAFGYCLLIDCHSMPSTGGPMDRDDGRRRADIVLGDRFGTTCSRELTDCVHEVLSDAGLLVLRNNPYAGGFTTYNYGRPSTGVHGLQIEINRALYMDEKRFRPNGGFDATRRAMTQVVAAVRRLDPEYFEPLDAAAE
ncbi:MAG TPA: N-formylglutamate amidohydrolase [Alphaproteobacteria bacterium]|nr:N-formylglutamate amidohydrolase [Alphaproteobacteria bacterium]